jgi:hypothetical protein
MLTAPQDGPLACLPGIPWPGTVGNEAGGGPGNALDHLGKLPGERMDVKSDDYT